jgi:hypothetical protein
VAVDAFRDSGLAVAVLTDEPFLNDHLAWNPDALVLTSGAPVRHNGTAIFAAELLRLCDGGPRELLRRCLIFAARSRWRLSFRRSGSCWSRVTAVVWRQFTMRLNGWTTRLKWSSAPRR